MSHFPVGHFLGCSCVADLLCISNTGVSRAHHFFISSQPSTLLLSLLVGSPVPSGLTEGDWQSLFDTAAQHGLAPLLYHRLAGEPSSITRLSPFVPQPASPLPDPFLRQLRESFLKNATRNVLLYRDLAQILTALQGSGVKVAVLKGAHLAALIYPHPGLRRMADIDILVPREQLALAGAKLRELGYSADQAQDLESQARHSHHLSPFRKAPNPSVEVHWTLVAPSRPFPIDPAQLLCRLRPANIGGVATYILAPEDFLLHQCIHVGLHHFSEHGLRPLCDLAATLSHHRNELDWKQVQSRAAAWNAQKCVYVALRLTESLLVAEVPSSVLSALRPTDFDEDWCSRARDQVMLAGSQRPLPNEAAGVPISGLANGLIGASLAGKVRFLKGCMFPPRDHMATYMARHYSLSLTSYRKYTCYLTRWLDLSTRGLHFLHYVLCHRQEAAFRTRKLKRQAQLWRWLTTPPPS